MGWDIHCVAEFKNSAGDWQVGQDYISEHGIDGSVHYQVVEPVAEFRNYNLFRVLAGVHNDTQAIEREKHCWQDYEKSSVIHNSITNYYRDKYRGEYWPETDSPVEVVPNVPGVPEDASKEALHIIEFLNEQDVYTLYLDDARMYVKFHPDLQQFRLLVDKMNELFEKCKTVYPGLNPEDFRLVYGFDY